MFCFWWEVQHALELCIKNNERFKKHTLFILWTGHHWCLYLSLCPSFYFSRYLSLVLFTSITLFPNVNRTNNMK